MISREHARRQAGLQAHGRYGPLPFDVGSADRFALLVGGTFWYLHDMVSRGASKSRFYDDGPYKGCSTYRLISIGGRRFRALRRTTIQVGQRHPRTVYVIPGPSLLPSLSEPKKQRLRSFSGQLVRLATKLDNSLFKAYKAFLSQGKLSREAVAIPWKFGPVPALVVGRASGLDVCATPVPIRGEAMRQGLLFAERTSDDPTYLHLLEEHLVECMDAYFEEIASLLRNAFFVKDKRHAGLVAHRIDRILGESVFPKLRDLQDVDSRPRAKSEFTLSSNGQVDFYSAVAACVSAAVAALRWSVGGVADWRREFDTAFDRLDCLSSDRPENEDLGECLKLLSAKIDKAELTSLASASPPSKTWISDLRIACAFIAHLLDLLPDEDERDRIHVFVTHHMDVFASEEFYAQLRTEVASHWNAEARVWTGYGREKHIQLSILAKLWLSEAQVFYFPNSLDTRQGRQKPRRHQGDWVIEELFYGSAIAKPLHFVCAENADDYVERFKRQLRRYDWDSIDPLMYPENPAARGKILRKSVEQHLRKRVFTVHSPSRKPAPGFRRIAVEAILHPCLVRKMEDRIEYLKAGLDRGDLRLVRAMARLRDASATVLFNSLLKASQRLRLKRGKITAEWLRRRLRKRILAVRCSLRGETLHLVTRRDDPSSYELACVRLAAICSGYCPSVSSAELEDALWDSMINR